MVVLQVAWWVSSSLTDPSFFWLQVDTEAGGSTLMTSPSYCPANWGPSLPHWVEALKLKA